jgi:ribosomal protein S12 methylthiotransferase
MHVSKPLERIGHEARALAAQGVKELIVIGQDTTYYGLDTAGDRQLDRVLRNLTQVEGIEWIRLMYAYPTKFPRQILKVFQESPKLCRYLDMPVQHIADNVLKSMRRGITGKSTRELLRDIKREVPGIGLRTTLIVGYPNESEADFEQLCEFVEEMQFHRLGVFTYSQEEGTTAFELGDPVPQALKEERLGRVMELQQRISEARNESLIGKELRVILDRREGEFMIGRTEWDAPEIDQEVFVREHPALAVGRMVHVRVTHFTEYDLYADCIER